MKTMAKMLMIHKTNRHILTSTILNLKELVISHSHRASEVISLKLMIWVCPRLTRKFLNRKSHLKKYTKIHKAIVWAKINRNNLIHSEMECVLRDLLRENQIKWLVQLVCRFFPKLLLQMASSTSTQYLHLKSSHLPVKPLWEVLINISNKSQLVIVSQ